MMFFVKFSFNSFTRIDNFFRAYSLRSRVFPLTKSKNLKETSAVIDPIGTTSYESIVKHTHYLSEQINLAIKPSKTPRPISFLCNNDASYVCVLLACFLNNDIAVPLCKDHPVSLLEYFVRDSDSSVLLYSVELKKTVQSLSKNLKIKSLLVNHPCEAKHRIQNTSVNIHDVSNPTEPTNPSWDIGSDQSPDSLMIYTSGTTGSPKGVVLTRSNLDAQINALVTAWKFTSSDVLLHTLPLHHMHGIVNGILCPLNAGSTIVMMPKFNAIETWKYLLHKSQCEAKVNMYFAVPTMYFMLLNKIKEISELYSVSEEKFKELCLDNIRLMTCGSAPLPEPVFHQWKKATGHFLLERYGMSEAGMILSNSLDGNRVPGSGTPLPDIEVCIASISDSGNCERLLYGNSQQTAIVLERENYFGHLLVKGPAVFKEYWNKPKETSEAFTKDGWFKTGDTAIYESGVYQILGRTSTDIIKSGGYKISALDVERHLSSHQEITDCTVFGQADEMWGEIIVALYCTRNNKALTEEALKEYCKSKLPPYSVPRKFKLVELIPRNIMGKVNKKELKEKFKTNK